MIMYVFVLEEILDMCRKNNSLGNDCQSYDVYVTLGNCDTSSYGEMLCLCEKEVQKWQ